MTKWFGPAVAAAAVHAALLAAYVLARGGDPAVLLCVGESRAGRPPYEAVHVSEGADGYDGQYYYAIARAPWRRQEAGVDCPPLRQARILYPLASWLLSRGDPRLLLWAMPAVNVLAIAGLAALGALLAARYGLSPWLGFLLPLAVGAALPSLRDLTDVVAACAVCALLAAWPLRWPRWALLLAAAGAVLAREQNAAVVAIVLVAAAWRGRRAEALGLAVVLLAWLGWLVLLARVYGRLPLAPAGVALPGAGLWFRLEHLADNGIPAAVMHAACLLLLLFQAGLAVYLARTRGGLPAAVALAGAALALVGGAAIYEDKWAYMRAFSWMPLGCWVGCVQARLRWPAAALAAASLLPLQVVVRACFGAGG